VRFIENIHHHPMFAVGTVIFLALGAIAIVWARRIQQYATEVRLCGILAFSLGVFCCWALFADH
jgi:hypothetical protein